MAWSACENVLALLGGDVRAGPDPEGGWTVEATVPVATVDAEAGS